MDSIIYVGNFFFPDKNASGKRVLGNLMAIKDAGYKTYAIGFKKESKGGIQQDVYKGIVYYSLPFTSGFKRVLGSYDTFQYVKQILNEIMHSDSIRIIIMYGSMGSVSFNNSLIQYCKTKNIKIVYDQVDYFNKLDKNKPIRLVVKNIEYVRMRSMLKKCDGYITISRFLRDRVPYGSTCIIVPPLAMIPDTGVSYKDNDNLIISYASFISDKNRPVSEWKDRIDIVIDVLYELYNKNVKNVVITFIGFTKDQLLDMFIYSKRKEYKEKLDVISNNIVFYSGCSNIEVQRLVMSSDFTILLRDSKVSTNAGFPTKVSESVSLGIPPIVNYTSDIESYIKDGINGVVVKDIYDIKELENTIIKLSKMTSDEKRELKKSTFESHPFLYNKYVDTFKDFIGTLLIFE